MVEPKLNPVAGAAAVVVAAPKAGAVRAVEQECSFCRFCFVKIKKQTNKQKPLFLLTTAKSIMTITVGTLFVFTHTTSRNNLDNLQRRHQTLRIFEWVVRVRS